MTGPALETEQYNWQTTLANQVIVVMISERKCRPVCAAAGHACTRRKGASCVFTYYALCCFHQEGIFCVNHDGDGGDFCLSPNKPDMLVYITRRQTKLSVGSICRTSSSELFVLTFCSDGVHSYRWKVALNRMIKAPVDFNNYLMYVSCHVFRYIFEDQTLVHVGQ